MPARIAAADPGASINTHLAEVREAVERVIRSGWFVLGEEVARFEEEFAAFCDSRHGVGVASGTDAVALALQGCGVGPGDAVFTVSHTAVATVAAIESIGATPVLVDVDADTFTMSPEALDAAVERWGSEGTLRPRAIVPVHLYGLPADMAAIHAVAESRGLDVVEDAAQAHGASLGRRRVGSLGRAAAFSFYPTKNLGAIGDGGMVVTSDPDVQERVAQLRQYGWRERYVSEVPGRNSRLDEVQAAVLRTLLPHLDASNRHRRAIAARYDKGLAGGPVALPAPGGEAAVHVYHQYVIRSRARDTLQRYLADRGVGTAVLYPLPVHRQPAYRHLRGGDTLPVTAELCGRILSLPMGAHVTADAADRVIDTILEAPLADR